MGSWEALRAAKGSALHSSAPLQAAGWAAPVGRPASRLGPPLAPGPSTHLEYSTRSTSSRPVDLSSSYLTLEPRGISITARVGAAGVDAIGFRVPGGRAEAGWVARAWAAG